MGWPSMLRYIIGPYFWLHWCHWSQAWFFGCWWTLPMTGSPVGPGGRGSGLDFELLVTKARRRLKRRTAARATVAKASFVSISVWGATGLQGRDKKRCVCV